MEPTFQLWHAIVLGLVEGITEYLPVSSTGHLILASSLMGLDKIDKLKDAIDNFEIVIQGGAILAVAGLYWPRVKQMLRGLIGKDPAGLKLFINICIAFVPAAVIGLILKKVIEEHLFYPGPVLLALFVGGLFMFGLDWWRAGRFGLRPMNPPEITDITPRQALTVGFLQCVSLWPGTSRSMMTIAGGLFAGLRPAAAAEFSFLLGLPTLTAATLYKAYKDYAHHKLTGEPTMFQALGATNCIVGMVVATVSAAIAVRWLIGVLNRKGLTPFAWYRIALCIVMIPLIMKGIVAIAPKDAPEKKTEAPAKATLTPPAAPKSK